MAEQPTKGRGARPANGDAKLARDLEHVVYELAMLAGSMGLLRIETVAASVAASPLLELAAKNAPVEQRALHARNVAEFLLSKLKRTQYLTADAYVRLPLVEKADLDAIWVKASTQIAHLSRNRVTGADHARGEGDKSWPPERFAPLLRESIRFGEALLASPWSPLMSDWPRATLPPVLTIMGQLLAGWGEPLSLEKSNG